MASQVPCGAERVGLRLLSGEAEKSNVIWFCHNCLSSLVRTNYEFIWLQRNPTSSLLHGTKISALHHQK
jgi:hypothetical protein